MGDTVIIIPARLSSTRLPNKPLVAIAGKTMIEHVYARAVAANVGDVYVASAEKELHAKVTAFGLKSLLVDDDLPSGSDRTFKALEQLPTQPKYIINLQGDVPSIKPATISKLAKYLKNCGFDIATLATKIDNEFQFSDPNTVKVIFSDSGRALYFTRASGVPYGEGNIYHHIGVYGYTLAALTKFISYPQSGLEKREKLEQLRALENGLTIGVAVVKDNPHGIDTADDLLVVRKQMGCGTLLIKQ